MSSSSLSRPRGLVLDREKQVADHNRSSHKTPFIEQPHIVLGDSSGQLFSFLRDTHYVTVLQDAPRLTGDEKSVDAPRFSLEQSQVVGFYPPEGHSTFNNILPHIVFRDQYLPWIRSGTKTPGTPVPWLALLVFTNDELTLQASDGLLPPGKKQDATGAVSLTFQEIFDAQNQAKITSPFSENDPEKIDPKTTSKFVFVPGNLFTSLFCKYNVDGSPMKMKTGDAPDPSRYKYLAHIRKFTTTGLPVHVEKDDIPPQPPSVVVSHRTAPVYLKETTIVSVHLVSLENVENVKVSLDGKRVAMCSLHSWTYNVFPPGTQTFQDKVIHLGETLDVLLPPLKGAIDTLGSGSSLPPNAVSRLEARVRAGYTLVRDKVPTKESPFVFTRSPCVPGNVAPMPNLTSQSWTSEEELQTFDQHLGIMDITYLSAWQLGKSLAVADRSFTAALGHLGIKIGDVALKKARLECEDTNPDFLSRLEYHCIDVASELSTNTAGTTSEEHSDPDWQEVFNFFLYRLFLYSVPTRSLLPDRALLPEESLRFFSIDKNWTNVSIDGALSVANHQQPKLDVLIRKAIKKSFQAFLAKPIPTVGYPPQVPTHGMLLRSGIVSQFPDLSIHAPYPNPDDLRAPILRQTVVADGILLVLFDRVPGPPNFRTLKIQLPQREERFSVGSEIDYDNLTVQWKRIYARNAPRDEPSLRLITSKYSRNDTTKQPTVPKVYDWPSRTLNMDAYTTTALALSQDNIPSGLFDKVAKTSVVAAIELSGSIGVDLADELYAYQIAIPFARTQLLSLEALEVSDSQLGEEDPRYEYAMWPIHIIPSEKPADNIYPIPFGLNYDIDIVFCLIRKEDWSTDHNNLQKLEIELTLNGARAIMTSYKGSGVYLASNMRWTEYVKFTDDLTKLKVGIVPRDDERGWSPVGDNKDLTFVLKGCRILDERNTGIAVVTEYYKDQDVGASGPLVYKLVPA